jgi:predicted DNA-binding protein (MmcQ/YjbR family)
MHAEAARALCDSLPATTWDYRYEFGMRAYRVGGKIFALVADDNSSITLKCDPALNEVLRQTFDAITPARALNKHHWIDIELDGAVPAPQLADLIRHAHDLVVAGLPKAQRTALRT